MYAKPEPQSEGEPPGDGSHVEDGAQVIGKHLSLVSDACVGFPHDEVQDEDDPSGGGVVPVPRLPQSHVKPPCLLQEHLEPQARAAKCT